MKVVLQQAGVIPFRGDGDTLQVLLITSRGSGHWVIPKGGIEKDFTAAQAAEREAYEEAGVLGAISATPLGFFTYSKRQRRGGVVQASVEVYTMRVEQELDDWPERAERRYKWVSIAEAVKLIRDQGIAVLLLQLQKAQELSLSHS